MAKVRIKFAPMPSLQGEVSPAEDEVIDEVELAAKTLEAHSVAAKHFRGRLNEIETKQSGSRVRGNQRANERIAAKNEKRNKGIRTDHKRLTDAMNDSYVDRWALAKLRGEFKVTGPRLTSASIAKALGKKYGLSPKQIKNIVEEKQAAIR